MEERPLGKIRKKTTTQFEVLFAGDFYGFVHGWTEYLCLGRNADSSITLSSRWREILANQSERMVGLTGSETVHFFRRPFACYKEAIPDRVPKDDVTWT
jgi:hypothetical protein